MPSPSKVRRDAGGRWHDAAVSVYLVAVHVDRTGCVTAKSKRHAYVPGAKATVCGFGLAAPMRLFTEARFSLQPQAARCPLCSRVVAGDH